MTALMFLAALAVIAIDPLNTAPTAAAQHRCLRIAVLTIDPHGQTAEDGEATPRGWFPLVCRHGAKFAATGRPADVDINGKALAAKGDFTEICGLGTELGGKVSHWIANGVRLNDDTPAHDEDRICLALHPVGLYCGVRANMAEVMSFRAVKGDIPIAVNEDYCPDR
jgi:hypothetical protein